jgi:DNA ligase-1
MFKPLLAPNTDPLKDPDFFKNLKFPLLASPKLDGIRCIIKEGACKSRKYLDLPSKFIQSAFKDFAELDGEIIIGPETAHDVYNTTQSYVMSFSKNPAPKIVQFCVFDYALETAAHLPFYKRYELVRQYIDTYLRTYTLPNNYIVNIVPHKWCNDLLSLIQFENEMLALGYEGIMMRDPYGIYKHGRSTYKQGILLKLKRFQDDEAEVIGFVPMQRNDNELETDELGYAKRSSAKAGMVEQDLLGKFLVKYEDQELEIAPGVLTLEEKKHIWLNRPFFLRKILKFRHFPYGVKDKPRFPRFVGWRNEIDMGE